MCVAKKLLGNTEQQQRQHNQAVAAMHHFSSRDYKFLPKHIANGILSRYWTLLVWWIFISLFSFPTALTIFSLYLTNCFQANLMAVFENALRIVHVETKIVIYGVVVFFSSAIPTLGCNFQLRQRKLREFHISNASALDVKKLNVLHFVTLSNQRDFVRMVFNLLAWMVNFIVIKIRSVCLIEN